MKQESMKYKFGSGGHKQSHQIRTHTTKKTLHDLCNRWMQDNAMEANAVRAYHDAVFKVRTYDASLDEISYLLMECEDSRVGIFASAAFNASSQQVWHLQIESHWCGIYLPDNKLLVSDATTKTLGYGAKGIVVNRGSTSYLIGVGAEFFINVGNLDAEPPDIETDRFPEGPLSFLQLGTYSADGGEQIPDPSAFRGTLERHKKDGHIYKPYRVHLEQKDLEHYPYLRNYFSNMKGMCNRSPGEVYTKLLELAWIEGIKDTIGESVIEYYGL